MCIYIFTYIYVYVGFKLRLKYTERERDAQRERERLGKREREKERDLSSNDSFHNWAQRPGLRVCNFACLTHIGSKVLSSWIIWRFLRHITRELDEKRSNWDSSLHPYGRLALHNTKFWQGNIFINSEFDVKPITCISILILVNPIILTSDACIPLIPCDYVKGNFPLFQLPECLLSWDFFLN